MITINASIDVFARCSIPERGTGATLVLPFCNTEAMQIHLDEIATKVAPVAHAIVLLDQAGWRSATALTIPIAAATALTGTQQSREHLAIYAVQPNL
jgi:hypothetical protein